MLDRGSIPVILLAFTSWLQNGHGCSSSYLGLQRVIRWAVGKEAVPALAMPFFFLNRKSQSRFGSFQLIWACISLTGQNYLIATPSFQGGWGEKAFSPQSPRWMPQGVWGSAGQQINGVCPDVLLCAPLSHPPGGGQLTSVSCPLDKKPLGVGKRVPSLFSTMCPQHI